MERWNFTPWLRAFHYSSDSQWIDQDTQWIDIYGLFDTPFTPPRRQCLPRVLTLTGSALEGQFNGINTCIVDHTGHPTVCNHVKFVSQTGLAASSPPKRHISIEKVPSCDVIRHLCLSFSDTLYICSPSVREAADELMVWIKGQLNSPLGEWPPVVILIPDTDTKRDLQDHCKGLIDEMSVEENSPGGCLEEALERALQCCTVFQHDCTHASLTDIMELSLETSDKWLRQGWNGRRRRRTLWTLTNYVDMVELFCSLSAQQLPPLQGLIIKLREQSWPGTQMHSLCSLSKWFSYVNEERTVQGFLSPVLAGLFIRDAKSLPHSFLRRDLFHTLYAPLCAEALAMAVRSSPACKISMGELTRLIVWDMEHWSSQRELAVKSMMKSVPFAGFCGLCLWHHPSLIIFQCGHRVCERDAWACSVRNLPFSTLSYVENCPVCLAPSNMCVRLRPPQSGFRIMTIDGGGVHGISPLVMWKYVLSGLQFGLELSDYVDLKVATSSGSIDAAGLIIAGMNPNECIEMFTRTAVQVFEDDTVCTLQFPGRFSRRILRQWLSGAKHSNDCLFRVLQGIFGSRKLKGVAGHNSVNNVRVAFTTTTLLADLKLLRTYDVDDDDGDLEVAYALQLACAAPTLFKPKNGRQDGAFVANNPSGVALAELNRLSLTSRRMLDVSISFGTGQFVQKDQQPYPSSSPWLCPRWISRLGRTVLESFSASRSYQRLHEQLSPEEISKYHRLDPVFVGRPIPLDAGRAVKELEDLTKEFITQRLDDKVVQNVRLALVATGFYAIARSVPTFDRRSGVFYLKIAIVSRWNDNASASFRLRNYLKDSHFLVQGKSYLFSDPLMITITAKALDTTLHAQLQPINSKPHNISGFPIPMAEFIFLQSPITQEDYTQNSEPPSDRAFKRRKLARDT